MEIFDHLCAQGEQDGTNPENDTDYSNDQTDTAIPAIVGPIVPSYSAAVLKSTVSWQVGVPCKCKGSCDGEDDNCYTKLCCTSPRKTLIMKIFGKLNIGSNLIALINHEVSQKLLEKLEVFCNYLCSELCT